MPPPPNRPLVGMESYERVEPIFTGERRFHPFTELVAVEPDDRSVELVLASRDGPDVRARLTFPDPYVVRFRWAFGRPPGRHRTEMLSGEVPARELHVTESEERVTVHAGGPPVVLERRPWRLAFGGYATEPADTGLVHWIAEPSGWVWEAGRALAYDTFSLHHDERLWGVGERFLGPEVRGRRLTHWIDTALGVNTTDRVHKSVPLVISNRGYGVFYHHPEEAVFDLGARSAASATVLVESDELDQFVLLGDPKEILSRYTALTGRPPVPPDWSFDPWMPRCMYESREQIEEVVETGRDLDLPVGVVNIDPTWMSARERFGFDACDFVWNEQDFGPLEDLVEWLHRRDVRLCLWLNPNVAEASEAYAPERLVGGGRTRDAMHPQRGFVDFTGGGADWWMEELGRLLDAGVDTFKLDYGEMLPAGARMADGRTGEEVHNLYPLLASKVAEAAGAPLCFTRGGTAGSQRYPLHWPGDSQSTWAGLAGALRGGLSAAWSGFAHWTSDIGGFHARDLHRADDPDLGFRDPDPELYIRWMQFGLLCSHTRFHGNGPREPWHFGDDAVAVAHRFWDLRTRLRGYLLDCAREASQTGTPIMRPVPMEFPDDAGARDVDHGYLLGPDLVVCPVLEPDGRCELYVPPGDWTDHFTGERLEGPRWVTYDRVPLDRIPLLTRAAARPFVEDPTT